MWEWGKSLLFPFLFSSLATSESDMKIMNIHAKCLVSHWRYGQWSINCPNVTAVHILLEIISGVLGLKSVLKWLAFRFNNRNENFTTWSGNTSKVDVSLSLLQGICRGPALLLRPPQKGHWGHWNGASLLLPLVRGHTLRPPGHHLDPPHLEEKVLPHWVTFTNWKAAKQGCQAVWLVDSQPPTDARLLCFVTSMRATLRRASTARGLSGKVRAWGSYPSALRHLREAGPAVGGGQGEERLRTTWQPEAPASAGGWGLPLLQGTDPRQPLPGKDPDTTLQCISPPCCLIRSFL